MKGYVIQLRTTPGCRIPDAIAQRRVLKHLGRQYGLRCVSVIEDPTTPPVATRSPGADEGSEDTE